MGKTDKKPKKFIIFIPLLENYSHLFHQKFCRIASSEKRSQRWGVEFDDRPGDESRRASLCVSRFC